MAATDSVSRRDPGVRRCRLRRRIEHVEEAAEHFADAFGGEEDLAAMIMVGEEFSVCHGDIPYTPGHLEDKHEPPWRIWWMLTLVADEMREALANEERLRAAVRRARLEGYERGKASMRRELGDLAEGIRRGPAFG